MSLSPLESLVGKNVILFNYLRNPFKNKIYKIVENGNEYTLYVDTRIAGRLQHRIMHPGIYFVTDVMIQDTNYAVYLKKQVDLKKFAVVSSASASEYYISSYRKIQYKTDGGHTFDALEFDIGGFHHLTFNYKKCIIAKVKKPGRKRTAVCLGDSVVIDDINDITCNGCEWFMVE
ncbi:hypothetical protein [Sulfolobus monocaudavirus SMV3]|jgi:hypothetical protein|uniref:hypothetical protein n=1 Tax=Sulfolobus monocaudavirus SMV3 TaxID=1732177 RepID=UPI000705F6E0|nr:hypothetical protein AXI69_gp39 [Sulfolobus monocaudavirus SMV3]ALG96976.1 hypothetical protein [Sulfolobus monocaudavirus SMV3]